MCLSFAYAFVDVHLYVYECMCVWICICVCMWAWNIYVDMCRAMLHVSLYLHEYEGTPSCARERPMAAIAGGGFRGAGPQRLLSDEFCTLHLQHGKQRNRQRYVAYHHVTQCNSM